MLTMTAYTNRFDNQEGINKRNKIANLPLSYFAEKWFIAKAKELRIKAANPGLDKVKSVLKSTLRKKFERVERLWIENELNPAEYLDRILKCDCILALEDNTGKTVTVSVDITLDPNSVTDKQREVKTRAFYSARKQLGIDRHWIVILPNNFSEQLNINEVIIDRFYQEVDNKAKIAIVNLR